MINKNKIEEMSTEDYIVKHETRAIYYDDIFVGELFLVNDEFDKFIENQRIDRVTITHVRNQLKEKYSSNFLKSI